MNNNVIVLGDVVHSSKSKGVQRVLHSAVLSINKDLSAEVLAPFEITRGDEVAMVCEIGSHWFSNIQKFIDYSRPLIVGDVT